MSLIIKSGDSGILWRIDPTSLAGRASIYDLAGDSCMDEANNALKVSVISITGSGAIVDDAAFTPGSSLITMIGATFDNVGPDSVDEGDGGALRMSANRNLFATLRDAAGNERGVNVTAGFALTVDGSAVTQPISGTVTINAIPAGNNNIGDVDIATVPAPLSTTGGGTEAAALRVTVATDSTGVLSVDDNGGSLTVDGTVAISSLPASTNTIEVVGDVAHDSAVGGNPVLIGVEARTTDGTAVTAGDVVRLIADTLGKQVVLPGAVHALRVSGKVTLTDNNAADVIAAIASNSIVVTCILVINSHATVSTIVEIRDGTTIKLQGYAAALGGGFALGDGSAPLFPQGTVNTAITAKCATTGSSVDVFVSGYKILN